MDLTVKLGLRSIQLTLLIKLFKKLVENPVNSIFKDKNALLESLTGKLPKEDWTELMRDRELYMLVI